MILQYFKKKENKDKDLAVFLYSQIIDSNIIIARRNKNFLIDDFNTTFEISTILLFCFFHTFKNEYKYKKILQETMNIFISDLDHSLRSIGISDMQIGKYVKKYVKKFYFRLKLLEKLFDDFNNLDFSSYISDLEILKIKNDQNIEEISLYLSERLIKLRKSLTNSNIKNINLSNFFN